MAKLAIAPEAELTPEEAAANVPENVEELTDRGDEVVETEEVEEPAPVKPAAKVAKVAKPAKAADPEAEAEVEAEIDPEADPEAPPAKRDNGLIPRTRYNEAVQKRRVADARVAELETELARSRAAAPQPSALDKITAQLDGLYEQVETARLEGNGKEAARLQRSIDDINRQVTRSESEYIANQRAYAAQQNSAYNAVVDQLELVAPELDPAHEDFNEDAAVELDAMVRGFEGRLGLSPADALKRAARRMFGDDVFTRRTVVTAPVAKAAPTAKKTNIAKNVDADNKQPPRRTVSEPVERAETMDIEKLSDDEFDKLPEATKKRLRGDFE